MNSNREENDLQISNDQDYTDNQHKKKQEESIVGMNDSNHKINSMVDDNS